MARNGRGPRTVEPEFLAHFRVDRNETLGGAQVAHAHHFRCRRHHRLFIVTDNVADEDHFRPAVPLGLGRVAHRLDVAFVEVFQTGQLHAGRMAGTAGFEIVGDLDDGWHRFAHLAEELQTDGARHRRHLVQHPAGGDDDAVGAFLLHAGNAAEELVGDVLAQPDLAAGGAGHHQNFLAEQLPAARIEALDAEFDVFLLVNLAVVVVDAFDFQPIAARVDHLPPGQVVERRAPEHGLLATGVHRDVAADAGGRGRSRVDREHAAGKARRFGDALGDDAGTGADGRVGRFVASQHHFLDRTHVDQLLGIDHRRIRGQRYGAAGIAGAAAARNDGQPGLDAATDEVTDFFLGIRVEDDKGIFDAPVGGVGDVRNAGEAVESDVAAAGMPAERLEHLAPQVEGFAEAGFEAADCRVRRLHQAPDLGRALRVLPLAFGPTLFDIGQAMAQRIDQGIAAIAIVEQVILKVGIALHDPDVAQHFVEHACRPAGDAFIAQFVEDRPVFGAEQADYDLAIGKRRVVVGDFAQAGGHGSSRDLSKDEF